MSRYAWSMCFSPALLMVGPWEWSTKLLRQTYGERYLPASVFLTNSRLCRARLRQFRHKKQSRNASDVITYPLIQETFAFVESNLECEICRQYFGVGFRSKQIWKRYCKKSVVHYNAIPSLNNWLPYKSFWSAACWMIVWRFSKAHIFSQCCPEDLQRAESGSYWGVATCGSCARQSRRIFAKKITPKSMPLPEVLSTG